MLEKQLNRKIYLSVSNGKIIRRTATGNEYYSAISGILTRIESKSADIAGRGRVEFWSLDITDGAETYSVSVRKGSGTATAILQPLSTADNIAGVPVKFEVYKSGKYTNVNTYIAGVPAKWNADNIPAAADLLSRQAYFEKIVKSINDKL